MHVKQSIVTFKNISFGYANKGLFWKVSCIYCINDLREKYSSETSTGTFKM